jgi:hypothetical protein
VTINTQVACRCAPRHAGAKTAPASRQNSRLMLAALALTCLSELANGQALPVDAKPACTFQPGEFSRWFATGAVTLDGAVNPADSLNFPSDSTYCDFYKWAERMFLWVTSPSLGGVRVFQSPDFYTITAPVDGKRALLRNDSGKNDIFISLRSSKPVEHDGQPGSRGVLMAQNKSLVYYASLVNDVYAYFLTGAKNGDLDGSRFPIQKRELDKIIAFGAPHGINFGDRNALAVTVKSAWVETTGLTEAGLDASKYIKLIATIPTYDTSSQIRWTPNNRPIKAELALVGMHIVGSAKGHADMIWATFEHVDNTPIASYDYQNTSDEIKKQPESNSGPWLFSRSAPGRFNELLMHTKNAPNIDAIEGKTIGPSDTRREYAWGSNDAENNTRIIAINKSIDGMLANGDVRKNYRLVGAAWSSGIGAVKLANTTMETYAQGTNCFNCHFGNLPGGRLSRMYRSLQPLFPPP